MDELRCKAVNYDTVGITESWGNTDIADAELNISGFHMFRLDRDTIGGGVLLYVSEALKQLFWRTYLLPVFGTAYGVKTLSQTLTLLWVFAIVVP